MSQIKPLSFKKKKKYYRINTYKAVKDEKQALNKIEELLFKSVEYRLNSDVEVASLFKWWN